MQASCMLSFAFLRYSTFLLVVRFLNYTKVYFNYLDAPKFTQSPNPQRGCIGKMINLNCKADGNPKPTVHVVLPDGKITNTLTIELKTFGVYQCEAKNNLGNVSRNITVSKATGNLHFVCVYVCVCMCMCTCMVIMYWYIRL